MQDKHETRDDLERLDASVQSADEAAFISFLNDNMVGQPQAKLSARRIYRAIHNRFREPDRPIHSAILAGESRRGKNHLVRLLARWFHGRDRAVVKVNGGEFMESHQLARLIGAPHGYIGFSEEGNRQRGKKDAGAILSQHNLDLSHAGSNYDVVFLLLDEWEKMHFSVINLLLAGLDEGEFTISNNTDVNFRNVVLLMTANMGMKDLERQMHQIGFGGAGRKPNAKDIGAAVHKAYRERTSPEFRNRIDSVVVFEPFSASDLRQIVGLEFRMLQERIIRNGAEQAFRLVSEPSAELLLLELSARSDDDELANLKRLIALEVVEPLSALFDGGAIRSDDVVVVSAESGRLVFDRQTNSAVIPPAASRPDSGAGSLTSKLGSGGEVPLRNPVNPPDRPRIIPRFDTLPDYLL